MEDYNFPRGLTQEQYIRLLDKDYIHCLTCGPVVYVRTLKCASTFFYNSLKNRFKWWEIKYNDIDWDTQHVFSHILEPLSRRHKGVAEYICMQGLGEEFINSTGMQKLVTSQPFFDMHSMSLSQYYGKRAWLIDWIPISDNPKKTIKDTENLLTYSCHIKYFEWIYEDVHQSPAAKKVVEQLVKKLWDDKQNGHKLQPLNAGYFAEDIALYQKVLEHYDPTATQWDQKSWLRHRDARYMITPIR